MKGTVEKRKPSSLLDYFALALTTFGVGYIAGAPGTYGSLVAVAIYLGIERWIASLRTDCLGFFCGPSGPVTWAVLALLLTVFILIGVWAANRSVDLLGNNDPSQAVVDEVLGQLVTLSFIPFGAGWPFILTGFLLFRLFDVLKPYPCRVLEDLPGGLGICADDIVAGVYAGICLAVGYAIYLAV